MLDYNYWCTYMKRSSHPQGLKTVSKSFRNKKLILIPFIYFYTEMLSECFRILSNIDHYIKYSPLITWINFP